MCDRSSHERLAIGNSSLTLSFPVMRPDAGENEVMEMDMYVNAIFKDHDAYIVPQVPC
jgi:hypothetical protein